jgi:hypothetical protein
MGSDIDEAPMAYKDIHTVMASFLTHAARVR